MTRPEKQAYWQQHIEQWEASDQSQSAYCEIQHLKLATFSYWRTRFLRQRLADEVESGRFVAVDTLPSCTTSGSGEAQAVIDWGAVRITLPVIHLSQSLPLLQCLTRGAL